MAQYIVLGNFTDQGIRAAKETTKRAKALSDLATSMGATLKETFWTLGAYDLVLVLDAPDDKTIAALMFKVGMLGNIKSQTLRAFDKTEMVLLVSKI